MSLTNLIARVNVRNFYQFFHSQWEKSPKKQSVEYIFDNMAL